MPQQRSYDEYRDGVLIRSTPYTVDDTQIGREQAPAKLRAVFHALDTWQQQAQAVADQSTNVTQAQLKGLFQSYAQLCGGIQDLLRYLAMDDG